MICIILSLQLRVSFTPAGGRVRSKAVQLSGKQV